MSNQPYITFNFTSATIDPMVSVTRALNTATRTNSNGFVETVSANTPRFDYDPVTLGFCRGLLIEEQRTNLLTYSEDFGNAVWQKTNASVTTNAESAPDGTVSADKFIGNSSATNIRLTVVSNTPTAPHTISVYAKKAEFSTFSLTPDNSVANTVASFNLDTGSTFNVGSNVTARIYPAGNGWYRCSVTKNTTSGTGSGFSIIQLVSVTGNGTNGIYLWGAQLEAGLFPTSYIPNLSTGTTTRNADVATITGANFSDWWQATRGGVLVRARPGTVSGTRPWVQFDDGTANNIIALRGNTTNPELYIKAGGVDQAAIDAGTIAANTDYSLTGWWATNDCKARLDSGAVVTDTSATIPTVTQARLGSDGTNYLNGHLASISYYDSFSEQIYTRRKNKAVFNLM